MKQRQRVEKVGKAYEEKKTEEGQSVHMCSLSPLLRAIKPQTKGLF